MGPPSHRATPPTSATRTSNACTPPPRATPRPGRPSSARTSSSGAGPSTRRRSGRQDGGGDARRCLRGGGLRGVARRRGDPRQPHRRGPDRRRPPGQGDVRARPGAHRRGGLHRGQPAAGRPPARAQGDRGMAAVPHRVRRPLGRAAPRHDGGHPDRPVRQPEHRLHRGLGAAEGPAAGHARRAGQHRQSSDELLGAQPLAARLRRTGRRGGGCRLPARRRDRRVRDALSRHPVGGDQQGRPRFRHARPLDAGPLPAPRRHGRRGVRGHGLSARRARGPARDQSAERRGAAGGARGARPVGLAQERGEMSGALDTRLCELVDVRYPIVQTGMGWVSGPRLTAASSQAGALGILAGGTMTLAELERAVNEVKERTDRPFGVNFRTDQPDVEDRVALIVKSGVKVASYGQAPRPDLIRRLRDSGVVNMPTIGARRHAEKVVEWGADAVIAQGMEGGGHTGMVPTSLLLPQVVDAVDVPVVAAGGFFDGRGLVAALAYGAAGVAMGTRFLLTRESTVPDNVKGIYIQKSVTDTVVSRRVDGLPQRVIRTDVVDSLERSGRLTALPRAARNAFAFRKLTDTSLRDLWSEGLAMKKRQGLTWSQMVMAANAPMMTRASMVEGRPEVGILPTGQVVGVIDELPAVEEVVAGIVRQAEETLARLGG